VILLALSLGYVYVIISLVATALPKLRSTTILNGFEVPISYVNVPLVHPRPERPLWELAILNSKWNAY
jgi:hypothetical protein